MQNYRDGIIGLSGIILTSLSMENISAWVGLICSLAITITTCALQVYRMFRDRDKDKEIEEKNETKDNEKE